MEKKESIMLDEEGVAKRWQEEITLALKGGEKWREQGRAVTERYLNERRGVQERNVSRTNILWSNVETIRPTLYSNTPKPQVHRRFRDGDAIARSASEIVERLLHVACDRMDLDEAMWRVVQDYLLPGRGVAWVQYRPQIEGSEPGRDGEPVPLITDESVEVVHLHWTDFVHEPARHWKEVTWVARRVYMSKEALIERFGQKGEQVPLAFLPQGKRNEASMLAAQNRGAVWEIWDRASSSVYWLDGSDKGILLDWEPDPLGLEGFFPCPRPLLATRSTDSMIPVPDYLLYQDQAIELDQITERLSLLTRAVKVSGVYNGELGDRIGSLLQSTGNQLIPVDNWALFGERGGLRGQIEYLPLTDVVQAITVLSSVRESIKSVIYEITGISDIVRGVSKASETATAQSIKSQWGGRRLQERQSQVQRFVRDLFRMVGEIMVEHFQPQTIAKMVGAEANRDVPIAQALQLLQNDGVRLYAIDIQTDSTLTGDRLAEKGARLEAVRHIGMMFQQSIPMLQQVPQLMPAVVELFKFGLRSFDDIRGLESAFDGMLEKLEASPAQPLPAEQKLGVAQGGGQAGLTTAIAAPSAVARLPAGGAAQGRQADTGPGGAGQLPSALAGLPPGLAQALSQLLQGISPEQSVRLLRTLPPEWLRAALHGGA